jgi:hypothetical protein
MKLAKCLELIKDQLQTQPVISVVIAVLLSNKGIAAYD